MKFCEKYISHDRCEEINNMDIVCPWSNEVFKMNEKGSKYLSNEDESIIYGLAFLPHPQDLEYESKIDYKNYYFLIKGDEYYLHALKLVSQETETIDGVLHVYEKYELPDDEKINNADDKEYILGLINFMYFHYFSRNKKWVYKQVLIYNGKEYTGEGVGEYGM